MREISLQDAAARIAPQMEEGVFLCVGGPRPNVMTIGWGGLTRFWGKSVFVAPVRPQRFTYDALVRAGTYTVCVPRPGAMADALQKAGMLTGADGDKFAAIGIGTRPAGQVDAPIIEGCALYLECVVRAQCAFDGRGTDEAVVQRHYADGDFHTLFFGEVVACYAEDPA